MRYDQNLKSEREKHGYSQKEIAYMLQTSQQQYSRWESGEFQMPIETYKALANIYETSIDKLCDYKSWIDRMYEERNKPFKILTPEEQKEIDTKMFDDLYDQAQDRKKELKALIEQYTEELQFLEKHW